MLGLLACTRGPGAPDASASPKTTEKPRVEAELFPSSRCGECHELAYASWKTSAHARARGSKVWAAMQKDATCDRCHAPLLGADLDEAVGCDACHTLRPSGDGGFVHELGERVRYGPLCDAKDHYFHKMGCAPAFADAELCGSCHLMPPAFTEYAEWKDSPQAADGVPCQSCHMDGHAGEAAVGAGVRERVTDHGLLGKDGKLRESAVKLEVAVNGASLDISVQNHGAGHRIPAGLPGKQLVLRVGTEEVAVFSKVLVDDSGAEAPFYAATKLERDDRLAPEETRRFTVPFKGQGEVSVVWRELSPALAKKLGVTEVVERVLVRKAVPKR